MPVVPRTGRGSGPSRFHDQDNTPLPNAMQVQNATESETRAGLGLRYAASNDRRAPAARYPVPAARCRRELPKTAGNRIGVLIRRGVRMRFLSVIYRCHADPERPSTARILINVHDADIALDRHEDGEAVRAIMQRHAECPLLINSVQNRLRHVGATRVSPVGRAALIHHPAVGVSAPDRIAQASPAATGLTRTRPPQKAREGLRSLPGLELPAGVGTGLYDRL